MLIYIMSLPRKNKRLKYTNEIKFDFIFFYSNFYAGKMTENIGKPNSTYVSETERPGKKIKVDKI